ncbi:hypothetical protein MXB_5109 [Myxobolus squamalis]|nr:hypothetical protein MXB_5109 [Myxobolus squamalis]
MEHIDDYFDLHDILASTCRISCKLECSIQNVGSIVSGNSSQHLPSGSNIDLPLWLVKDLSRRENIIKFDCPKYFKKSYREIQDADPKVLNLRKMGPWYKIFRHE